MYGIIVCRYLTSDHMPTTHIYKQFFSINANNILAGKQRYVILFLKILLLIVKPGNYGH